MKTYQLPSLYVNKLAEAVFSNIGFFLPKQIKAQFECQPYRLNGEINSRYAQRFAEKYQIKRHYANNQLTQAPLFPLLNQHQGKKFLVLGNGPSLKQFDFSLVKDAIVIGTNTSSEFYHANYVFISSPFALIRAQKYLDLDRSILLLGDDLWNEGACQDIWRAYDKRIIPLHCDTRNAWDLSQNKLIGQGPLAGLIAIDIAILMGAGSILVVGCDGYKGKNIEQMYAGKYARVYKKALSKRFKISDYEKMLWQREAANQDKYCLRQDYCQKKQIRFAFWGPDLSYQRVARLTDQEVKQWV